MLGLLIKDLYTVRKLVLWYLAMIVVCFTVSVYLKNISFILAIGIASETSMVMTTFAYEERDSWSKFVTASGLNSKTIVLEKYILGVAMVIFVNVIGVIAFALVKTQEDSWSEVIIPFLFQLIVISCCIPAIFKYGVEKSRIILIVIIAIAMIALVGTAEFLFDSITGIATIVIAIAGTCIAVGAIIISYFTSVSIYNKKEF